MIILLMLLVILIGLSISLAINNNSLRKDLFKLIDINRRNIIIPVNKGEIDLNKADYLPNIFTVVNQIDKILANKYGH